MRRFLFLAVGTLVLWYMGHFGLGAVLQVVAPNLSASVTRAIDLGLVPVALLVSWRVMRRLVPGGADAGDDDAEPHRPAPGRSDPR